MEDILHYFLWQYLSLDDLFHFALTNHQFYKIWQHYATWKFLIGRDFTLIGQTKEEYQIARRVNKMRTTLREDVTKGLDLLTEIAGYGLELSSITKNGQLQLFMRRAFALTDGPNCLDTLTKIINLHLSGKDVGIAGSVIVSGCFYGGYTLQVWRSNPMDDIILNLYEKYTSTLPSK